MSARRRRGSYVLGLVLGLGLGLAVMARDASAQTCMCECGVCAGQCDVFTNSCGCAAMPTCTSTDVGRTDTDCGPTCGSGMESIGGDQCPYPDCSCACTPIDPPLVPGTPCDDHSACTTGDALDSSCVCRGTGAACTSTDPCRVGYCTLFGTCATRAVPNGTRCADDGDPCDGTEICFNGRCISSTPPNCDDGDPCTMDLCNPMTGGCTNMRTCTCASDADCLDSNACNGAERCVGGACAAGDPLNCDDGSDCTQDSCDPRFGCMNVPPIDKVCGCFHLVPHTPNPDSPSPVVLDGVVHADGSEYGMTPVGYAQTAGLLRAAIYMVDDANTAFIGALPVDAGAVIEDGFLEIDWNSDGIGDLDVRVGGDIGDGGAPDALLSTSPAGLEFRVPFNLLSGGRCPSLAVFVKIANTDATGRWPASSAGGPYQCTCPPASEEGEAEAAADAESESEAEGARDGGADGDAYVPFGGHSGCCAIVGGDGANVAPGVVVLFVTMILIRARRLHR